MRVTGLALLQSRCVRYTNLLNNDVDTHRSSNPAANCCRGASLLHLYSCEFLRHLWRANILCSSSRSSESFIQTNQMEFPKPNVLLQGGRGPPDGRSGVFGVQQGRGVLQVRLLALPQAFRLSRLQIQDVQKRPLALRGCPTSCAVYRVLP